MIRIAQASSSENFTKYGVAPNQRRTGVTKDNPGGNMDGELNIVKFEKPWEAVYRPLDDEIAERIATIMERAVANGSGIGYSWDGFTELFDEMIRLGTTDPSDVKKPVNTDCTGLIGCAVYFAGIRSDKLRTLTTAKMDEVLMATGAFEKLTDKDLVQKGVGARRGDLVWRTGHAGCVLDTDEQPLMIFQKFTFNATAISSGTPGTRAAQLSRNIGKTGYRPIGPRLASVSNSALVNVSPFLGGGEDKKLYVNFYRASGSAGKVDCSVLVIYVRKDVTTG